MLSIVLTHLNTYFPYINDCIDQINYFNDIPIYYVGPQQFKKHFNTKNVIYIEQESIQKNDSHNEWCELTSLDTGFWRDATERFFYVQNVMKTFNLNNVFHLETDNLIFFNIKEELYKFENNYNIAATFDCSYRCVPGFMYFKTINFIEKYTTWLTEKMQILKTQNKRRDCNDMETWAEFRNRYPEVINNLPRMPKNYNIDSSEIKDRNFYLQNIDTFQAIFDGAEIGQYLGGVSPRNGGGKIGFVNETCIHKIDNKFNFSYERDTEKRKVMYLYYKCHSNNWDINDGKEKYRVNSLHVHSKNLINFTSF